MRKIGLMCVVVTLLAVATVAMAEWVYNDAKMYEFTNSVMITNLTYNPIRISGMECNFTMPNTNATTVSRIRDFTPSGGASSNRMSLTNLLRTYAVTNDTVLYADSEEFDGVFFKRDDIIRIADTSGKGITNVMILDTEADVKR